MNENEKKKLLYTNERQIAMYVIPQELIGKYSYKELTGGEAVDKEQFDKGTKRMSKEPEIKFTATATYDFEQLQKFFRVLKTLKATHITINLTNNEPMKITALSKDGEEIAFWIAPYMNE